MSTYDRSLTRVGIIILNRDSSFLVVAGADITTWSRANSEHSQFFMVATPEKGGAAAEEQTAAEQTAMPIKPIVFDIPAATTAEDALNAKVAERRQEHENRAKRFGVSPAKVDVKTVLGSRRAATRQGFATGFDVTSKEEEERRQKRTERFGVVPAAAAGSDEETPVAATALERRREAVPGEEVRENALHVFGVDDLETAEIMRYFTAYGPSWVEWLNDSSCNVAFEDEHSVKRILRFCAVEEPTTAPAGDAMGDDDGDGRSAPIAADDAVRDDRLEWREAKPVQGGAKLGQSRRFVIWMRVATEKDVRPERPNPRSRWARTIARDERNEPRGRRRRGRRDVSRDSVDSRASRDSGYSHDSYRSYDRDDEPRRSRRRGRHDDMRDKDEDGYEPRRRRRHNRHRGRRSALDGVAESRVGKPERASGKARTIDIDKPLSSK